MKKDTSLLKGLRVFFPGQEYNESFLTILEGKKNTRRSKEAAKLVKNCWYYEENEFLDSFIFGGALSNIVFNFLKSYF